MTACACTWHYLNVNITMYPCLQSLEVDIDHGEPVLLTNDSTPTVHNYYCTGYLFIIHWFGVSRSTILTFVPSLYAKVWLMSTGLLCMCNLPGHKAIQLYKGHNWYIISYAKAKPDQLGSKNGEKVIASCAINITKCATTRPHCLLLFSTPVKCHIFAHSVQETVAYIAAPLTW